MMAIEKIFVKESIKEAELQEWLAKRFEKADFSKADIQKTPLGTRIMVYAYKPGLVVGRSGRRINEIAQEIKEKFGIENPMLDVMEVEEPFLDARIVAKRVARAIERGINYKKVCKFYVDKVMQAGATGVQIEVGGKLAGVERSRFQKFRAGYITHSGEYAETLVDKGMAKAMMKPGLVGVKVFIMKEPPKEFIWEKKIKTEETEEVEEEKTEEVKED